MSSLELKLMLKESNPCLFLDLEGRDFSFETSGGSCYQVIEFITIVPTKMKLNWLCKMIPHKEVKRLFKDCEISPSVFETIKKEFPQIKFVVEDPPFIHRK